MADPNIDMAAALQGGLLPAPAPTPEMLRAALGSPLDAFHPYHPGDDPIAELSQQRFAKADPTAFAMGIMGGPRGLKLNPARSDVTGGAMHDIVDPTTSNRLGYINLDTSDPKKLWVKMIDATKMIPQEGGGAATGPNAIGTGSLKSIVGEIKDMYPEAEKIGGFRVSGARDKANATGDAWMRLRPPTDPTEPINEAAQAAMRRWKNTANDLRYQTNAALAPASADNPFFGNGNGIDRQSVLNRNLNTEIGDPATNEITARRNAVRMGQPNWSEVPPNTQQHYRNQVTNPTRLGGGEIPNREALVVDPAAEQTTRNRWMSAQMGRATRQGNQATQAFIDDYNRRMAEVLSRGK